MSYSEFTMDDLKSRFHLNFIQDESLFPDTAPFPISAELKKYLETYMPLALAIDTEKARSEFIVAPLLGELKMQHRDELSLFSGIEFNVDKELGLTGRCDFILSKSGDQYTLTAPVVVMVEAKNDNIKSGIPQCAAEMVAAQKYNAQKGNLLETIYGCVSTGTTWKFLKLEKENLFIDQTEYYIDGPEKIMGILVASITGS